MIKVPREIFVPVPKINLSNLNRPLEVANGQTISQPSLMAYMIDLLELDRYNKENVRVLEIGTCSGYNAVLLQNILNMYNYKSYTIDTDYQVRIYSEDFFVNEKNILRDDNRNTDGLIGNISSLKIEPRSEDEVVACTFYQEKIIYSFLFLYS